MACDAFGLSPPSNQLALSGRLRGATAKRQKKIKYDLFLSSAQQPVHQLQSISNKIVSDIRLNAYYIN